MASGFMEFKTVGDGKKGKRSGIGLDVGTTGAYRPYDADMNNSKMETTGTGTPDLELEMDGSASASGSIELGTRGGMAGGHFVAQNPEKGQTRGRDLDGQGEKHDRDSSTGSSLSSSDEEGHGEHSSKAKHKNKKKKRTSIPKFLKFSGSKKAQADKTSTQSLKRPISAEVEVQANLEFTNKPEGKGRTEIETGTGTSDLEIFAGIGADPETSTGVTVTSSSAPKYARATLTPVNGGNEVVDANLGLSTNLWGYSGGVGADGMDEMDTTDLLSQIENTISSVEAAQKDKLGVDATDFSAEVDGLGGGLHGDINVHSIDIPAVSDDPEDIPHVHLTKPREGPIPELPEETQLGLDSNGLEVTSPDVSLQGGLKVGVDQRGGDGNTSGDDSDIDAYLGAAAGVKTTGSTSADADADLKPDIDASIKAKHKKGKLKLPKFRFGSKKVGQVDDPSASVNLDHDEPENQIDLRSGERFEADTNAAVPSFEVMGKRASLKRMVDPSDLEMPISQELEVSVESTPNVDAEVSLPIPKGEDQDVARRLKLDAAIDATGSSLDAGDIDMKGDLNDSDIEAYLPEASPTVSSAGIGAALGPDVSVNRQYSKGKMSKKGRGKIPSLKSKKKKDADVDMSASLTADVNGPDNKGSFDAPDISARLSSEGSLRSSGEMSLSEPNLAYSGDEGGQPKGFTLPRLRMPRFKKNRKTPKDKRGSDSFDVEVGGSARAKRSSSLPDISYDTDFQQQSSGTHPDTDSRKKKRWSGAFKLPSFGFPKFSGKQRSQNGAAGRPELSAEADVSVDRPAVKRDLEIGDGDNVFPEVDAADMAFKKVGDVGNDIPELETNFNVSVVAPGGDVTLPEKEIDLKLGSNQVGLDPNAKVDLNGDGSFGINRYHRTGIDTPDGMTALAGNAQNIDVGFSVDAAMDDPDQIVVDTGKDGSPHLGLAAGAGLALKAKKDGDTESLTSSSSSRSEDTEKSKKKRKGFFAGVHLPKFKGKGTPRREIGTGVSFDDEELDDMDIDAQGPTASLDFDRGGIDIDGDIGLPDMSVDQKNHHRNLDVYISVPDIDGPDVSGVTNLPKGDIELSGPEVGVDTTIPSIGFNKGDVHIPEIDDEAGGDIELPKADLDVGLHGKPDVDLSGKSVGDINSPRGNVDVRGDVNIPSGEVNVDLRGRGGIDLPGAAVGFNLKKDRDTESVTSTSSSSSSEGEKTRKKKKGGLFGGFHLPKFKGKGSPKVAFGTDVSFDGDVDVNGPGASLDIDRDGVDIGGGVILPEMSVDQKNLNPDMDLNISAPDFDGPDVSGDIHLPKGDIEFSGPEVSVDANIPSVGFGKPKFDLPGIDANAGGDLELPTADREVDIQGKPDVDLSGKLEGDFNLPRGDTDVVQGDVDIPSGGVDVDLGGRGGIGLPGVAVGLKLREDRDAESVTSSSSSESERTKMKKKGGLFGGFHLPKFKGKGSPKKAAGANVDFDADVNINGPNTSLDIDRDGVDVGGRVVLPESNVDEKNLNPDLDVNISVPDFDGPGVSGGIRLPKGDIELSGPEVGVDANIPSVGFDEPDVDLPEIDAKAGGAIELPRADLDVNVQGKPDIDLSRGDVHIPSGDVDVDIGGRGGIGLPGVAVGFKLKKDRDTDSVTSTSSSSSSESGKTETKKKGGLFGGFHLPKFKGKGSPRKAAGIDVNFDGDVDVTGPKAALDVDRGGVVLPKLSVDENNLNPDIDVNISGDIHLPKGDIELSGPEVGVDAYIPSVGFDKPDVDLPDIDVKAGGAIELPKAELDVNTEVKPDVDLSGKLECGISLPRGDIEGNVNIPSEEVGVDFDGRDGPGLPGLAFGLKLKKDRDTESVTSSSSSESDNEKTKKKGGLFGGFHLPKFKGKGSSKKAVGTGVSFDDDAGLDMNVEGPEASLDLGKRGIDIDGDIVLPDVSADQKNFKPGLDVNLSAPDCDGPDFPGRIDLPKSDIELSGPEVGRNADIPSVGFDKPDVDLPEIDVKAGGAIELPKTDLDVNVQGKPDVDLSGDLGGDVHIPSGEVDVDIGGRGGIGLPGVAVGFKLKKDRDAESVTSSSSSESERTKMKKKGGLFGGFHLPKFKGKGSPKKAAGANVDFDADVNINGPNTSLDIDRDGVDVGGRVVLPESNVDEKNLNPDLDVNISVPDFDGPDASGRIHLPKGDIELSGPEVGVDANIPSVGFDKPDVDLPEIDAKAGGAIELPRADLDVNVQGKPDIDLSGGDVHIPSGDVDVDIGGKGGIGLPGVAVGFKLKKDRDTDSVTSTSSSSSSESGKTKTKKKGGLFGGFHLPKFKGKGSPPRKAAGIDVNFDGDVDVTGPKAALDVDRGGVVLPKLSVDENNLNPDIDVNISGDIHLPKGDIELSGPEVGVDANIPSVGFDKPDVDLPDIDVKAGGAIELPKAELDVNTEVKPDVDLSGKLEGDINLPRGDIEGDVNIPSGEVGVDFDGRGGPCLPGAAFGLKLKKDRDTESVTSSSSSESDNEKTKKKGGMFGGFHLPKFKGKGSSKKAVGTGVSFDDDAGLDINVRGPETSLDLGKGDIDIDGGIVLPNVSVDQRNFNPDLDVNISAPGCDGPDASGGIHLPKGDIELRGPEVGVDADIPAVGFKKPDVDLPEIDVKADGDIELPKADLNVDIQGKHNVDFPRKLDGDLNLPRGDIDVQGDVDIPSGEVDVDLGGTGGIGLPGVAVGFKLKKDRDTESVTSSSSSSSSESERAKTKKKGGLFGGFHLPKFKGKRSSKKAVGTGVSFDDDAGLDINVRGPETSLDLGKGDIDIDGGIVLPNVSVDQRYFNPDSDVNISAPDYNGPDASGGIHLPKGDIELKEPEVGVDANIPAIDFNKPDVDLPEIDVKAGGDIELPKADLDVDIQGKPNVDFPGRLESDISLPRVDVEGDVDIPSGEVDADLGGRGSIGLPGVAVGLKLKKDRDTWSVTSSSSSSSESERAKTKKKGGLFGGFHLPKFKGKRSPKKAAGVDVNFDGDVDVTGPKAALDVDRDGVDIGGGVVLPRLSVDENNLNPDIDVNISGPNVSGDIHFPKSDIELSGPEVGVDANIPSVGFDKPDVDPHDIDVKAGGAIELPKAELDVNTEGKPDVDLSGKLEGDITLPRGDVGGDVNIPSGEVGVDFDGRGGPGLPGAAFGLKLKKDRDTESVTSSSSSERDNEKTKKKGGLFGGFHLPKFKGKGSSKKAVGTGVSFDDDAGLDMNVEGPEASLDLGKRGIDIDGDIVLPDVSADQKNFKPGLDVNHSAPDCDGPDFPGRIDLPKGDIELSGPEVGGVNADIPSVGFDKPDVDLPEIDVKAGGAIELPKTDLDVNVQGKPDVDLSRDLGGDVHIPSGEVDVDIGGTGGIGLPGVAVGFNLKKDRDTDSVTSTSSSSSSESEKTKTKKKGGLFGGFHLPKFKGKGSPKKAGTGVGFDGDVNVTGPEASIDIDREGVDIGGGVVLPELSVDQKNLNPDIDVNISGPNVSGDMHLPKGDSELRGPEVGVDANIPSVGFDKLVADLPDIDAKAGGAIELPKKDLDVNIHGKPDVDFPGKFEGDITFPRGDVEGDVDIPSGEVDVDLGGGGGIGLPGAAVGLKLKKDRDTESVTSSSSSSSSESEKKKKKGGLFGGIHLPKFKGRGPPKRAVGTGVSFDDDAGLDIDVEGPNASLDLDRGKIDIDGDAVLPDVSVDQKNLNPDIDVNISAPGIDSRDFSGEIILPKSDIELSGPEVGVDANIPSVGLDKPDVDVPEIDAKAGFDIGLPKADLDVNVLGRPDVELSGKLDGGLNLPRGDVDLRGDVDIPSGEVDVDLGGRGGGIGLPGVAVGLKLEKDSDTESVTSSSSSESEKTKTKKKGGLFGGFHLPKFKAKGSPKRAVGTGVSFDDAGLDINVEGPNASLDLVGDVVLPDVSVNQKNLNPDLDVDISAPDFDGPDASGGIHLPKGDIELCGPEVGVDANFSKPDVDIPNVDLRVGGDIELPKADLDVRRTGRPGVDLSGGLDGSIDLPKQDLNLGGDVDLPSGEVDVDARGLPGVGVGLKLKRDRDSESMTSSSSSFSSESEKVKTKKKGLFGGLHLPKFKGKGPPSKSGEGDFGLDVDVQGLKVALDVDKDGVDFGGNLVVPDIDADQRNIKPDTDIGVSLPCAGGLSSSVDVQSPSGDWEMELSGVKADPNLPYGLAKPDVDLPQQSGRVDGDIGISGTGDLDIGAGLPAGPIRDREASIDVEINISDKGDREVPQFGLTSKRDDRSLTLSSTSSDGEGKPKKGFFGGIHMPKFKGKGSRKSDSFSSDNPDVDVAVGIDVDVKPCLGLKGEAPSKAPRGIMISSPEFGADRKVDLDAPDVDATIEGAGDHDLPELGGDVSLGVDFDTPELKGSSNVPGDGKIGVGVDLNGVDKPDLGGKMDFGADADLSSEGPKVDIKGTVGFPKVAGGVDVTSETTASSSSEDEDHAKEKEKRRKKGFSLHLPKFGRKKPKKYAGKVEVELNNEIDIPDTDVGGAVTTGPDTWDIEIDFGGPSVEVEEPVDLGTPVEELDFSSSVSKPRKPELDLGVFEEALQADVEISIQAGVNFDVTGETGETDIHLPKPEVESDRETDVTFANFGKLLAEDACFDVDVDYDNDDNVKDGADVDLRPEVPVASVNRKLDLDNLDWGQLGLEVDSDLKRSSSKSSAPSSEDGSRKKKAGTLPARKLPKSRAKPVIKVDGPGIKVEGDATLKVDIPTKEAKSPKEKRGLFKRKPRILGSPKSPRDSDSSVSVEGTPRRPTSPPGTLDLSGAITTHSMPTTPQAPPPAPPELFSVVVAIDFGTTFSGYAYSFGDSPEDISVMRKWEGGDPGAINRKTLTTLLLTLEGQFHSFGFAARDYYNDMNHTEAQKWLYFEKYKLVLHEDKNLNMDTLISASNGTEMRALDVFEHTLRFFKDHFLEELSDLPKGESLNEDDIRWVISVPAIWQQSAKQFMRRAAYKAGIASPMRHGQLLIALEPEAASIYIGTLTEKQLMPERMALQRERFLRGSLRKTGGPNQKILDEMNHGSRYVVVDCGGGTSDVTVHEVEQTTGTLKELHKAAGGMFGSGNVDDAFVELVTEIFGKEFIDEFKLMRPAGWVDLMLAFEARKRNANPWKSTQLNVALPFSFVDYFKKFHNDNVSLAQPLEDYNSPDVRLCSTAPPMLGFSPKGMARLFEPTTGKLMAKIDNVVSKPELAGISHLFLAGGFAESPLLQRKIRTKYQDSIRIVIPREPGLATLKGAVLYGHNPNAVRVRRTRLAYGVGALNRFNPELHPEGKKIVRGGIAWCRDIFDVFVRSDQPVSTGEVVTRSYAPASTGQEAIKINVYCSERDDVRFITDEGVRKWGTLIVDLEEGGARRRELQLSMQFGDTEMKVNALDVSTGVQVDAKVDFLSN